MSLVIRITGNPTLTTCEYLLSCIPTADLSFVKGSWVRAHGNDGILFDKFLWRDALETQAVPPSLVLRNWNGILGCLTIILRSPFHLGLRV
jgi:hypothetical protein